MSEPEWRWYPWRKTFEAMQFARAGGIALAENPLGKAWANGRTAAHMFGPDKETLLAAALSIGLKARWIQYPDDDGKRHFDVKGWPLQRAITKCTWPSQEKGE